MLSASGTKNPPNYAEGKSATPDQPLASQLALSSRKLDDLLNSSQGCHMHFNKYIPTYNHFLGRQFR